MLSGLFLYISHFLKGLAIWCRAYKRPQKDKINFNKLNFRKQTFAMSVVEMGSSLAKRSSARFLRSYTGLSSPLLTASFENDAQTRIQPWSQFFFEKILWLTVITLQRYHVFQTLKGSVIWSKWRNLWIFTRTDMTDIWYKEFGNLSWN